MAFQGFNFIFNDVQSERYNLKIGYFDGGGKTDSSFGSNVEIIEEKIRRVSVPFFYGTEITPPLTFDMVVFSEQELDAYDRQAIGQWLFGKQEYKYLQIEQKDLEGVYFRCILMNPETIYIGNGAYGKKFTVRCDAPWGWSDEKVDSYTITTPNQVINYTNLSDADEYLYPLVTYTLGISTTTCSVINLSDSSREFKFTSVSGNEVLTVDNQRQIITSSLGSNRLSNFNLKWLRLVPGLNQLRVTGNGTFTIRTRFPKKVGG